MTDTSGRECATLAMVRYTMTRKERDTIYHTHRWRVLQQQVMAMDNYECQICKQRGRHSRGQIVHHRFHVEDFPEFAFSVYVERDGGNTERNLITVCRSCHENVCHPERLCHKRAEPITEERW